MSLLDIIQILLLLFLVLFSELRVDDSQCQIQKEESTDEDQWHEEQEDEVGE